MDQQAITGALAQVRGLTIDPAALQAHVMSPANTVNVVSSTGLLEGPALDMTAGPKRSGPVTAHLHLDVNAFGVALHNIMKDVVAGYTMRLRQGGNTIWTLEWNWAQSPSDGSEGWTPDVRMHLASCSKLITAIAMAKLLNDKNMSYDTAIGAFLPQYWTIPADSHAITFRQLMTHTSGLDFGTKTSASDFETMKAAVAAGVPKKGNYWYQNMNFGLCRILIATINGNFPPNAPTTDDPTWDFITIQAYLQYVQAHLFAPSGVSGATTTHPSADALAYDFPVTGGWDSGDITAAVGGIGWHTSCDELLDLMGTFRRKGTIMTTAQAQTMLDSGFGIDVILGTPTGTLYNKNGAWGDNSGHAEQSLAFFLPEDMELVVLTNSPVDTPAQFFRSIVLDLYLASLDPSDPAAPTLFQLQNNGEVAQYTGTPLTGWQVLDNNPATKQIASPAGGGLYQLHKTGLIWQYTGTPLTGWLELDSNPATVAIAASAEHLYQLHNNGAIYRYTGTPITGWQLLDNNPATVAIAAFAGQLYQLHNTGIIWQYTGTPLTGWKQLDNNPATVAIVASGGHLYQRHNTGSIWQYTGTPLTGWQQIDNNPGTMAIVASGDNLYQLHNNGQIWQYTGTPMTGWKQLDGNPATVALAACGAHLYQLHKTGLVWEYTGTPLTGWKEIGNNAATSSIVAGYLQ